MRLHTSSLLPFALLLSICLLGTDSAYSQGRLNPYVPQSRFAQPYGRNQFAQPYGRFSLPYRILRDPDRLRRQREYEQRALRRRSYYRLPTSEYPQDFGWNRSQPRFDPKAENAKESTWELLGSENYDQAFYRFGAMVEAEPNSASHRIGYALAAFGKEEPTRGAWAIHWALHYDPEGWQQFELPATFQPLVQSVRQTYQTQLSKDGSNLHAAFMLAALQDLLGQEEDAKAAMQWVEDAKNPSQAARHLCSLLHPTLEK